MPSGVDGVVVRYVMADCKVYATGKSFYPELQEAGVMDQAMVLLEFPSGVTATIELSRCSPYGYDQRLEVRERIRRNPAGEAQGLARSRWPALS